jgi:SpoIID/LytB domain protein
MTLRRLLFRGLVPLSVFAVLATLMVAHGISRASEPPTGEPVSQGTPAVVRDRSVPVTPKAEREPAPVRTSKVKAEEEEAPAAADTVVAQLPATKVAKFSLLGVTWREGLVDADTAVEVRWRGEDGWSDWTALDMEFSTEGTPGTEPYWVGSADAAAVRVLSSSDAAPKGLELATVDPGKMPTMTPTASLQTASSVSQPTIISRAAWGADNSGTCDSPIYGSALRGAVIHHTAGSNTEPKDRSAAVVKATQAYHMNSRDWCDIAYNFLVDRYGQIFEGRKGGIDKVVRGAHSGNGPVNEETTGIALMGTFTTAAPPAEMKSALVRLTAWKLALHGVAAKGTYSLGGKTLNRIAGHRDVVSTECPGAAVYSWLTSTSSTGMRTQVADAIAAGGSTASLPTPTGLAVTGRTLTSVALDWNYVAGAERYHVKVSTSSTMESPVFYKFDVSKGTVTGLKPGTRYYFSIAVVDPVQNVRLSPYSAAPHPTAETYPAATPTNLAITSVTASSLSLNWDDVPGAEKYHVKVSTSSTMSSPIYGRFTASEGTVSGLKSGTKYYASVVAVDPVLGARIGEYTEAPHPSATTEGGTSTTTTRNTVTIPSTRTFTVLGHGFGHGIGMSQYGAQGAATAGEKFASILSTYYPGTALGTKTGNIRVLITADTTASVMIRARSSLTFRKGWDGTPVSLPSTIGGAAVTRWMIVPLSSDKTKSTLQYMTTGSWVTYDKMVWTGEAQFEASAIRLILPGGSDVKYRGALRSASPTAGSSDRNTVNVLPIESYVRGVVPAEMPSSWHTEALKAQSVAARTYGVRGIDRSRYYDMCDTTSCQVYRGYAVETDSTDAAIAATASKILTYEGAPAFTQFSSSSGGYTAPGSQPYLKAVPDPHDDWSGNANHDWTKSVSASTIEKAHPSLGTLKSITITKRNGYGDWNGRVLSLDLVGSQKTITISGNTARTLLGLKSNWFRF